MATATPAVPLPTPLFSVTLPVAVPVITAASFAPLIVMLITCAVPSAVVTVTFCVSVVFRPVLFSAWTAALLSSSVKLHAPAASIVNVP